MTTTKWDLKFEYMPRPMASAEAWVYSVKNGDQYWGTFVDEKIRYKTLFEPGSDIHEDLDEIIVEEIATGKRKNPRFSWHAPPRASNWWQYRDIQ